MKAENIIHMCGTEKNVYFSRLKFMECGILIVYFNCCLSERVARRAGDSRTTTILGWHPGSADCARRRTRRDAPTWSLAPVSSLSLSLARSARGITEKGIIHQGDGSSRSNDDDPRPVVVHSRARIQRFTLREWHRHREIIQEYSRISKHFAARSNNLFKAECVRSTLAKFEVKRSSSISSEFSILGRVSMKLSGFWNYPQNDCEMDTSLGKLETYFYLIENHANLNSF